MTIRNVVFISPLMVIVAFIMVLDDHLGPISINLDL